MSTKRKNKKNPAAQALGALGGAKGGKRRAETTSKKRLSEIGFIGSVAAKLAKGLPVSKADLEKAARYKAKGKKVKAK